MWTLDIQVATYNDLNILQLSSLYEAFIDGSIELLDVSSTIGGKIFGILAYLVDGIYLKLNCFIQGVACSTTNILECFTGWQDHNESNYYCEWSLSTCFTVLHGTCIMNQTTTHLLWINPVTHLLWRTKKGIKWCMGIWWESSHTGNILYWRVNYFQASIAPMTDVLVLFFGTYIAHRAKHTQTAISGTFVTIVLLAQVTQLWIWSLGILGIWWKLQVQSCHHIFLSDRMWVQSWLVRSTSITFGGDGNFFLLARALAVGFLSFGVIITRGVRCHFRVAWLSWETSHSWCWVTSLGLS